MFGGGGGDNVAEASFSGLFAPVASDGNGKWGESEHAQRNEMFFTVEVSKKVVERKFVLASDRRAAAKRRNAPQTAVEAFVPLAEQLLKIQQERIDENVEADSVMTFAPPKHEARSVPVPPREDPAPLREDPAPTKRFRTVAANRAAAQGGAVGVPMIPKMALTRPEEFDFATAARELAKEGTVRVAVVDMFEEAEADVRTTSNKIGMFVDLDGDLDQDTVVAKRATTGKKRNPGRSRLHLMEEGSLAQPDFGEEKVAIPLTVPKTPNFATAARVRSKVTQPVIVAEKPQQQQQQQQQQPPPPPQLTVPKTPKFATASRSRVKKLAQEDAKSRQPLNVIEAQNAAGRKRGSVQVEEAREAPRKRATIPLTVPRSPQFATTKRFNRP